MQIASKPDYSKLRFETPFQWGIISSYDTLLALTGIPIRDFYLNPEAGIEAYRRGRPLVTEMFGPDVPPPALATPHVSYGHVNCLGAELLFPEGGEVCHGVPFDSLDDAIAVLHKKIDWPNAGMASFYMEYGRRLSEAFDGEECIVAFGLEGPLTTAYTLRGHGIFTDSMDDPPKFKQFLELLTKSILDFGYFYGDINGWPRFSEDGAGLCDDVASMFHPDTWPEYVLPYWDLYLGTKTNGPRFAHVEDLRVEHLKYLEEIGLTTYDPSISHKLNPVLISQYCRVPFQWRLGSIHYAVMSCQDVRDFVFRSVADGASSIFADACEPQCNAAEAMKVKTFIETAREVEKMLTEGAAREDIGKCTSKEGMKRFWDHWPE